MISSQKFNGTLDEQTGKLTNIHLIGQSQLNNIDQEGWKDTEVMLPGQVTRVIAKFDLPGRYEWHCHILSHEDHDMMRPFEVSDVIAKPVLQRVLPQETVLKNDLKIYPNPFAFNTTINFEVSIQSKVSINVYTLDGRKVSTLFQGEKTPGIYNLSFKGDRLAAGVYICRLNIGSEVLQQKLFIQR
jgi:spore coat protein A